MARQFAIVGVTSREARHARVCAIDSPIGSRRAARRGAPMTTHIDHYTLPAGERINFILFATMGACLLLVMIAGTAGLVWNGKAPGNIAATVADVFAWLFAAAFLTAFLLALIEQRRNANHNALRGRPARDSGSRHLHG